MRRWWVRVSKCSGVLVDVGGAEDAVDAALGGEGHRARDGRLGRLGRIDDLVARGRHVLHLEGLQPDANLLRRHGGLREERSGEVEKKKVSRPWKMQRGIARRWRRNDAARRGRDVASSPNARRLTATLCRARDEGVRRRVAGMGTHRLGLHREGSANRSANLRGGHRVWIKVSEDGGVVCRAGTGVPSSNAV